jgi:hypothetical protein
MRPQTCLVFQTNKSYPGEVNVTLSGAIHIKQQAYVLFAFASVTAWQQPNRL